MLTIVEIDYKPSMYYACESVGKEVLLIRDNKIVGEGYSSVQANGKVSIEMRDERAKDLVRDSYQVKMWQESFPGKEFKWSLFKFSIYTGEYLDEDDSYHAALDDIRVVDKRALYYGMVPDSFKNVEGYLAVMNQREGNAK